ncbi:MAG TPA: hypothetical protein VFK69_14250 [Candidatus Eisenbacteria bacterium]|nr:hypothetical protein [Candidatus Eisenbacteria bacterium]
MSARSRALTRDGRFAAAWATALATGALAVALAHTAARTLPAPRPLEELAYYPSGRFIEPATLGHAQSAADLAWLRAVQYYGEHRDTDNHFARMAHVFDILTTLAPHFTAAYAFGGFALAQEGRDFAAAERLMQKGVDANPTDADLAFEFGFLYYVKPGGRDLERAAEYFERAARLPNPPPMAARFAAFARQNAGELAVAYALWADVRAHSPNRYLRDMAEREMDAIRRAWAARRLELARRHLATPGVQLVR